MASLDLFKLELNNIFFRFFSFLVSLVFIDLGFFSFNEGNLKLIDLNEDKSVEELLLIKPFCFLTIKPIIYLANVKDDQYNDENNYYNEVLDYARREGSRAIKISAKLECDLVDYTEDEKKEMLEMLGISESGIDELIKASYELLGLRTYFTVGTDEVRAWTFKNGMNAKECAGIIHTDFEKGFIRAEVIAYDDLIKYGDELKVKEAGKFRLEGKDYLMQDGDICHFRFNV